MKNVIRLSHWIGLCLLGTAIFNPSSAYAQCNEQVLAHSSYGDGTQGFDGTAGSVDLLASYDAPACLIAALPAGFVDNATDNPQSPSDRHFPIVLDGYKAFDPGNPEAALLRFDVFFGQNGNYENDAITFFDDTTCTSVGSYAFNAQLEPRLIALNQVRSQWVSLVIDLRTGQVFAAEVDGFGVPIPGMDYGQIGTVSFNRAAVLAAAADGDLHGWVQDDTPLGYVTFYAKANARYTESFICPASWNLLKGTFDSGGAGSLCSSDNHYLIVRSAQSDGRRRVEWTATFNVGTSPVCSLRLEAEGNLGRRGNNIDLHVLNRQTGNWDGLGTASFPLSPRDAYTIVNVPNPSAYIDANGNVQIRVHYTRGLNLGTYHMAADLLRLRALKKQP